MRAEGQQVLFLHFTAMILGQTRKLPDHPCIILVPRSQGMQSYGRVWYGMVWYGVISVWYWGTVVYSTVGNIYMVHINALVG